MAENPTGGIGASTRRTIGDETDLFIRQIDGLADTLPLAIRVIQTAHRSSKFEFEGYLDQECAQVNPLTQEKTYHIESGKYFRFRRLQGRFHKAQLARQLVPRTFLVSLVSQFDAFIGRLVRQLFNMKPEALDSSQSTLTFTQLMEFGSIENAREYIIGKEIDSLLRKSHADQFTSLENRFGIKLRVGLEMWPTFIEVTERRNLFVHSNGIVSHQYLDVCREHNCTIEANTVPGQMLSVSRQYFEMAHECLFEIGVKLAQVLWRKTDPDRLEVADGNLLSVGYELIEEGRYRLARSLLDFSTGLKKHSSEVLRLSMVINRAQAYKWSMDDAKTRQIIGEVDWSATALKFQMAQSILLDDFKTAIQIMAQIGPNSELNNMAYREWPLFKEVRKNPEFSAMFECIFKEPLNLVRIDPKGPETKPN